MAYRVLIVDDQREISRLLRSALETIAQGLVVTEAPSGEEAMLEISRTAIDLLVVDFRLPGITGVELIRKVRNTKPNIKIILITGVTEPKLLKEAQNAPVDAFFTKPVPMGDFLDAVERALGMARTIVRKPTASLPPLPEEAQSPKGLAGLMVELRKDLNASSLLLIDQFGHIQAEAGQLPDPNSTVSVIASLMGMFSAAQKVASLLNHAENHLHLFDGATTDGIFLPVGPSHALLILGEGIANPLQLAPKLDRLFTARIEILDSLKQIGVDVQAPPAKPSPQRSAIEEPFTQPEDLPREFLDIFSQVGKQPANADDFWDTLIEQGTTYSEPDKLTWEQAQKLGLTPDSDSNRS